MLVTNVGTKLHRGLNELFDEDGDIAVSTAYITPGACEQLSFLRRAKTGRLRLSVGRALFDGLSRPCKDYLLRLHGVAEANGGGVRVLPSAFHSKIYTVQTGAYIGSSNLTEHGIGDWLEANVLLRTDAAAAVRREALRIYDGGVPFDGIYDEIKDIVPTRRKSKGLDSVVDLPAEPMHPTTGVSISLLDRYGQIPAFSGLNWGLAAGRPRDRYECYIRFPTSVHEVGEVIFGSNKKGTKFVARTHDGKTLYLRLEGNSRAGRPEAKQISTDGDKSALGRWMIIDCLGIKDGRAVTSEDLERYGRTTVEFYRTGTLDDGRAVVYLDFARG